MIRERLTHQLYTIDKLIDEIPISYIIYRMEGSLYDRTANRHFKMRVGQDPKFINVEPCKLTPDNMHDSDDDDNVPHPAVYKEKPGTRVPDLPPLPNFSPVNEDERHPAPKPVQPASLPQIN